MQSVGPIPTAIAGRGPAARRLAPGLVVALVLAAAAQTAGALLPLAGAPVLALAAGLVVRTAAGPRPAWGPGVEFTLRRLLRLAIVLFGATLGFTQVVRIGAGATALLATTVLLALGLTALFGRWLRAPGGLVSLIGAGTAICGATAILTIGPIIEARQDEVAFAVTTIFLFNMLAVVLYPVLGQLLALSDTAFGVWAGAAIHDTSSVLAAAFQFSEPAGQVATVVKLTRTLLLVPLALAFGVAHSVRRSRAGVGAAQVRLARIFPWFVVWFAAAALLHTLGLVGPSLARAASVTGRFLVVMVMVAVGLSADLAGMRRLGLRPFYIGLLASVAIAAISLALLRALPISTP
ncbi:MAG: putative sulfate exporter family transporter [Armatimonadota bacterium]|nr:putative sulfate exporter family transporter [Armatimonadota bacterium]MDR7533634.1 putative sulfate exporter family transporter [Armatimonadota bacterium]MDR7537352.1 putative sulfate exporter family transporter [Armatimonadota bacterium]